MAEAARDPREVSGPRVVVASCGEDLGWIRRLPCPVTIYAAGGRSTPAEAIAVPNQAREAGMYLRHIVRSWPHFAEWEIFLQGRPFDHAPKVVERIRRGDYAARAVVPFGRIKSFRYQGPRLHDQWAARFASEWMGGLPTKLVWVPGAQFSVHRKVLLARSRRYWRDLLEKVLTEDSTSPWAIERLWMAVL